MGNKISFKFQVSSPKLAALITGLQILPVPFLVKKTAFFNWLGAYRELCNWDCGWYINIAEFGYHTTIPPVPQNGNFANVAFFPGYPYLARLLFLLFKIPPLFSLLFVAQIGCFFFWWIFLKLLKKWRISKTLSFLTVFAIICHPAGFYLVAGYSESLFLLSFFSLIYFHNLEGRKHHTLASLGGFAMSSTRILGLPLSGYPLLDTFFSNLKGIYQSFKKRQPIKNILIQFKKPLLITLASSCGSLFFLIYCQLKFGSYNIYMQTQRIGWGVTSQFDAIFHLRNIDYAYPYNRLTIYTSIAFAIAVFILELVNAFVNKTKTWQTKTWVSRMPLYLCSIALFYITISGTAYGAYQSFIRYSLPWYILLVLCSAQILNQFELKNHNLHRYIKYSLAGLLTLVLLGLFYCSTLVHLRDYLNRIWFA